MAKRAQSDDRLEARLGEAEREVAALREALTRAQAERDGVARALDELRASRGFKLLSSYWRARDRLAPHGSRQRRFLAAVKRLARGARSADHPPVKQLARKAAERFLWGGSAYNPYGRLDPLKPIPVVVHEGVGNDGAWGRDAQQVSLVCTVYDEAASIETWLASVARLRVLPDEVVIADGGSTDGTPDRIEAFAQAHPGIAIRVLRAAERINIAQGRNRAIRAARNDLIACTDAGCILEEHWLGAIVAPLQVDPEVDVSMGTYVSAGPCAAAYERWFVALPTDPARFLPSSRSVAFRKSAWEAAGGYPEWLTLTGEDTVFDLNLRKVSRKWAYAPAARVRWSVPSTLRDALRLAYRYGRGNGEAGLGAWFMNGYRWTLALRRLPAGAWLPLALVAAAADPRDRGVARLINGAGARGCVDGDRERVELLTQRGRMKGNVLILTGVPLYDCGGGQRGTQMALGFVRQGLKVTFVNVYPAYESNKSIHLDTDFELLELCFLEHFDVTEWAGRHRSVLAGTTVVLEFPHPRFLPIVRALKRLGARIVYDCIDNWSSVLGGDWYTPETEAEVIAESDVLVASARALVERLEALSHRDVHYLPQAVNPRAFAAAPAAAPTDLPQGGGPILLYVGSLWGSWFDWDLVLKASQAFPDARLVFIGEYGGQCPYALPNVHFLGLKPHGELAGYLAAADACLIPFKVDEITRAVNPLKVYEYLAMGKPVVSSALPELEGMPYVFTSGTPDEFVENVRRALGTKIDRERIRAFVEANGWENRVEALLRWVGGREATATEPPARPMRRVGS
jgi:glycosyltransferase involved in cell wall biosynthesis